MSNTDESLASELLKDRIAVLELMASGLLHMHSDGTLGQQHLIRLHSLVTEVSVLVDGRLPPD